MRQRPELDRAGRSFQIRARPAFGAGIWDIIEEVYGIHFCSPLSSYSYQIDPKPLEPNEAAKSATTANETAASIEAATKRASANGRVIALVY